MVRKYLVRSVMLLTTTAYPADRVTCTANVQARFAKGEQQFEDVLECRHSLKFTFLYADDGTENIPQ